MRNGAAFKAGHRVRKEAPALPPAGIDTGLTLPSHEVNKSLNLLARPRGFEPLLPP